jgi:transposase
VGKWRKRFAARGVDGLLDEPRPGKPRQVLDETVAEVVSKTLESVPQGATHWSTRTMAKKMGLSHSTVGRIWRAFGLKPHRTEAFTLSREGDILDLRSKSSVSPAVRPVAAPYSAFSHP